jgi:hypothetical protein
VRARSSLAESAGEHSEIGADVLRQPWPDLFRAVAKLTRIEGRECVTAVSSSSGTLARKIKNSLVASAGNIVFGMEDGTVSIFGPVFCVAASAPSGHAVLLAGATGAAAAAVSMMAGTYLDISTANDRAQAEQ